MAIYVDGDACPVKEEVYRVARRYVMKVYVVANTSIRVPEARSERQFIARLRSVK